MFIVSDDGRDTINADMAFAFSRATLNQGGVEALLVTGLGAQTILVKGGEHRCDAALRAIVDAMRSDDVGILRLDEASGVGPRPKDSPIAVPQVVVPAAFDPRGNGGRAG